MSDALRNVPLESETFASETLNKPAALPGTSPLFDEREGRRMKREHQPALVNAAESVGSTVGRAVGTLEYKVGSAVGSVKGKVLSGLEVVKSRAADQRATAGDLASTVRHRTDEFAEETRRRLDHWGGIVQQRIALARRRGAQLSRERPAELVLGIGGAAFLAGIILRLWRSNRD